ncbi:hypothetical protein ACFZAM_31540 [Streptomyces sp. NPDC008079]|uniref:hypothetical protein n=1 Tax=Streptomyces sp. NPDC008079 TaxID=3364806 RepID=UPI0036E8B407
MHRRTFDTTDLADLAERWNSVYRTWNSDACVPTVDLTTDPENPKLMLGDLPVKLTEDTTARLCAFYGIPTAFFKRLLREERQYILSSRIQYASGDVTVAYNQWGLVDIRRPSQPRLDAEHFLTAAEQVMPADALVTDAWWTPEDMCLDVFHPGIRNNLRTGLRFAQKRKSNLSPTVQPLLLHVPTTSLLQIPDPSCRIDARGQSIDRIASLLTGEALRANARLDHDAEAFAALSHESVEGDRITRLNRIADEHGLPVRPMADITAAISREESPTLQDLTLAISNAANAPALADHSKRGSRARLQAIAGAIVNDHSKRCASCYALVAA